MKAWLLLSTLVSGAALAATAGESPRSMMVEVKIGSYEPLIDRVFSGKPGPYALAFGTPMLLGELELDYEFFKTFGSLSGALSVGYAEKYAKSFIDIDAGTRAEQSTSLQLVPLKALLTYRFDYALEKWGIPFVPYVKGGLVMIHYWGANGPSIETAERIRGEGNKFGFVVTPGLALCLDFLDSRLARDFDTGLGVNHTYLFAEWNFQEVTNFGAQGAKDLDLSSRQFMFGLAFEL